MQKNKSPKVRHLAQLDARNEPGADSLAWNERVAQLLDCVDEPEALARAILRALEALFPVRFAYVAVWGNRTKPLRLWSSPPNADASSIDRLIPDLDPMVTAIREGRRGTFSLRDVVPPGFADSELYQKYYVSHGFVDEITHVPATEQGRRFVVSGGVTHSEPFTAEELSRHDTASPTIVASLLRLSRLVHAELNDVGYDKDAPGGDVDSALNRFGREILSDREREVVHLMLRGHNTESVAQKLEIARNTVRRHQARAYQKLRVSSQGELFFAFLRTLGLPDENP